MVRYCRLVGSGYRLAHIIWALLSASLCVFLVFADGSGHPPIVIFLPLVLAIWCFGHGALWSIRRLQARGKELAAQGKGQIDTWPPGLIVALIGTSPRPSTASSTCSPGSDAPCAATQSPGSSCSQVAGRVVIFVFLRYPVEYTLARLHIIWALLSASLCVFLVFADGSGHPPIVIFLPLVLAIWCFGHGALWRQVAGGKELAAQGKGQIDTWPPGLIVALIGTGIVSCVGIVQLAGTLLIGMTYPFAGSLWGVAIAVALAHGACFVGILLRRPWSRPTTAVLSIGWTLLLVWQIIEQLVHGHPINLAEYVTLFVGVALVSFFGYHLLSSRRIRAFLGSE